MRDDLVKSRDEISNIEAKNAAHLSNHAASSLEVGALEAELKQSRDELCKANIDVGRLSAEAKASVDKLEQQMKIMTKTESENRKFRDDNASLQTKSEMLS